MQAAGTAFVVDGVDPRVTLERLPVPVPLPSLPPAPSRAPYPLLQSTKADAPLRSLLRRDFEGVVHSEIPCVHAQTVSASIVELRVCPQRASDNTHRDGFLLWKFLG